MYLKPNFLIKKLIFYSKKDGRSLNTQERHFLVSELLFVQMSFPSFLSLSQLCDLMPQKLGEKY